MSFLATVIVRPPVRRACILLDICVIASRYLVCCSLPIDANGAWTRPAIDGITARTMSAAAQAARMIDVTARRSHPGIEKLRRAAERDAGRGPERSHAFRRTPGSAPQTAARGVVASQSRIHTKDTCRTRPLRAGQALH